MIQIFIVILRFTSPPDSRGSVAQMVSANEAVGLMTNEAKQKAVDLLFKKSNVRSSLGLFLIHQEKNKENSD
jgi:hypothetical protein